MSTIFIENLIFFGIHGATTKERGLEQPFRVDIELEVDTHRAEKSDQLDNTVDYRKIKDIAMTVVQGPPCNLIEKIASDIARKILEDKRVGSVKVSLRKLKIWKNGIPGVVIRKANN